MEAVRKQHKMKKLICLRIHLFAMMRENMGGVTVNTNRKDFIIDRIPMQFSEGPFWGNGVIGTVMYVKDNELIFSVDHVNIWELREELPDQPKADFQTILNHQQEFLHGDRNYVEDTDIFHRGHGRIKLPGLGVSLPLRSTVKSFSSSLNLKEAYADIELTLADGSEVPLIVYVDSNVNILFIDVKGGHASDAKMRALGWDYESPRLSVLKNWNYPPCKEKHDTDTFAMLQEYSGDGIAVLAARQEKVGDTLRVAVSMNAGKVQDEESMLIQGLMLAKDYMEDSKKYFYAHKADWKNYYAGFDVHVPNERLQEAFDTEMYKLYCNERSTSMPVTLQGVWNSNERMPAWYGDLHNDLNVEACYWAAFRTGNANLARPYVEYYTVAARRLEERAYKLFGVEDAIHIPIMMAPNGYGAASEWCFWNSILGPELFVATDFCWFYEYTQDRDTLKTKILPFLKKVANLYIGIAEEDSDGFLHIPFTCSPEFFAEGTMLMQRDATFTISVLHYLMDKIKKYGELFGEDTGKWTEFGERLTPVTTDDTGFPLFPGIDLPESHRHFCHMFPIFPLCTESHNVISNRSLDHVINLGFGEYAAFSFPYMSVMASRCGRGNMAETMLDLYCMAFRSRNTFTVNGDSFRHGLIRVSDTNAGEGADAFTLESGFFVPEAVAEMFVHRSNDDLWIGFGIPENWKECTCRGITVEGAHQVAACFENYHFSRAELYAGSEDKLVIHVREKETKLNIRLNGKHIESTEVKVKKGDVVTVSVKETER